MKKIFTLLSGLLLLSALPANAEKVWVYLMDWDNNDIAEAYSAQLTKDNDGVYSLSNFLYSGESISFTFPALEPGDSGEMTITSNTYGTYFTDADGYGLYCWLYGYNGIDDWTELDDPRYYKGADYTYVDRNKNWDYEYTGCICVKGTIVDEDKNESDSGWFQVIFDFNYIMSPLEKANQEAYDQAISDLDAAQEKYEAALAKVTEENPDFDFSEWSEMITNSINESKSYLAQALVTANEDKTEFPAFSTEEIDSMIAEMELAPLKADNQKAYEAVLAEIEAVQAKYDEAVEAIEKEYPGIDLGEWKEIIGGQLAQTKAAAEQALNAANEDGEKYSFAFDAEEYDGMIAEMQKAAPNQAAYSKVMATINALQEEYDEAVETIKEVNPEFDFADYEEIETLIAQAKQGADAALADVNENGGEFTFAFDGQDIEAFIIEMKKAGYEEHNTLAYDKVVAAIAEVEAKYTAAVAEIEKEYEGIDLGEWKQIIGGQLDEIKKGAEQALAAANENGELYNFAFDGEEYEGMIEEMQKAAPNQAAYSKVLDEINAVEEEYNDAVEAIKEVNPDFDFADWTEIETQIADAKKGAAQALDAANEDGEEFSYAFGAEDIENFIIEMKKAGFADYNQAAYDQAIADIAALEAKYDEAVVEIEETYPDYDLTEWKEIIGGQLAEAKSGAEQAYTVASEYGEKFFFPVDTETFEGMIQEMQNEAKLSGIANIEAEIAAGKAKIFTLDGKAHFAPVKGQVNVIVRENSTVKVMVK